MMEKIDMKKLIALILCGLLCFGLAACKNKNASGSSSGAGNNAAQGEDGDWTANY
jgi:hypothetical protein